jgi:hypothetical protein
MQVKDLGKLQAEVMKRIEKASSEGDGHALGVHGPIAADMERKGIEWDSLLNLSQNDATGQSTRIPYAEGGDSNGELTGRDIYAVTIRGSSIPVSSYKEALFVVVERLQAAHPDFDQIAPRVRGRRPYFSPNKGDLRKGERLKNSRLFIETNVSADRAWYICQRLVETFGYNPNDRSVLHFDVAPQRTHARRHRGIKRGVTSL